MVHCVACPKFKPCVEIMLRGVTERMAIDGKINRVYPFKELAIIFNNPETDFEKIFLDH